MNSNVKLSVKCVRGLFGFVCLATIKVVSREKNVIQKLKVWHGHEKTIYIPKEQVTILVSTLGFLGRCNTATIYADRFDYIQVVCKIVRNNVISSLIPGLALVSLPYEYAIEVKNYNY